MNTIPIKKKEEEEINLIRRVELLSISMRMLWLRDGMRLLIELIYKDQSCILGEDQMEFQ